MAKGKNFPEFHPFKSDFDKKINQKNLGELFKEREKEKIKILQQINSIPEYKQSAIDNIISKMKNDEYKPKIKKSDWSKNMRIMYNAEAEFIGEQSPFWSPSSKESDKNNDKSNNSEFYPNKNKILYKYPSWSIGPKKKEDLTNNSQSQYIKARNDLLEEKANAVLQKIGVDKAHYLINPVLSYDKVKSRGKLPIAFRKIYDFTGTEQYKSAKEKNSCETPAPNTYWDDGNSKIKLRKNIDDTQAQKYVMLRSKSYNRLYVPYGRKSVF